MNPAPSTSFESLIQLLGTGKVDLCRTAARALLESGVAPEDVVKSGIVPAMNSLDASCSIESFNLLEIMLVGRAVNGVLAEIYPENSRASEDRPAVILATLEGDVHDIGKNLVKTVLEAEGFRVVDLGKNRPGADIAADALEHRPVAIGISGMLTTGIPAVKSLREELASRGVGDVPILVGGAALKQCTPESLNVDFVAETVFDGLHYLQKLANPKAPSVHRARLSPLENLCKAIRFEPSDFQPVVAQILGHAAIRNHVPLIDYRTDGRILAECQMAALHAYGYDAVFGIADFKIEAEALGTVLDQPHDAYANTVSPALAGPEELSKLRVPDPSKAGRMPQILLALSLLRKEAGARHLVCGCVVGPATIAADLLGMETALFLANDDPETFEKVLRFCAEVAVVFGRAQVDAGAHCVLIVDPVSSPAALPPALFKRFSAPLLKSIFAELKRAGSVANWLHIAGPTAPILAEYPAIGVDLANIDYYVPMSAARAVLPHTCIDGNLRTVTFVQSSPSEIREAAHLLRLEMAAETGWILSSGCEMPPESRPENIAAFVNAARDAL